ncbi:MAG: CDP-glucose 4,6-dehydratase [Pseudomonadota bacterium]
MALNLEIWAGRRVLVTGHTGFKGAWAGHWLARLGAEVTGFALPPEATPDLHSLIGFPGLSVLGDLRDRKSIETMLAVARPEIVLHMAAQPLVRRSYVEPIETFASNVMGTAHLLEALRGCEGVRAVLVVTSDKVYENDESGRAFAETDPLGGHDPYAASKAATEIVAASYRRSYLAAQGVRLATARGGNVIGGGDFSEDRLVPDIVRAIRAGQPVELRNPGATRPWQHVLDCLSGYLTFLEAILAGPAPEALNFGPADPADALSVAEVTAAMQSAMGAETTWQQAADPGPVEMAKLAIDATRARETLGWQGRLSSREAIRWTADWYGAWANGGDMLARTTDQIAAFEALS